MDSTTDSFNCSEDISDTCFMSLVWKAIIMMGPLRGKSYAISSLLRTLVLLLFYFTSNTSVDILRIASVTALHSPQYVSNFLPDTGPRPKKELLRNFEVFAMALWSPGQWLNRPSPSRSLFLFFILTKQKKSYKTCLHHSGLKQTIIKSKAMKNLSPPQFHTSQVTSSTQNHLSKAASQHPPPSFSSARITSKAWPTATISAKGKTPSPHRF